MAVSKTSNEKLQNHVINLERGLHTANQYSRRECLKLSGVPESIPNETLEIKVCELLNEIGADVSPNDLEASHRLKKKDRAIIKFSNRKT